MVRPGEAIQRAPPLCARIRVPPPARAQAAARVMSWCTRFRSSAAAPMILPTWSGRAKPQLMPSQGPNGVVRFDPPVIASRHGPLSKSRRDGTRSTSVCAAPGGARIPSNPYRGLPSRLRVIASLRTAASSILCSIVNSLQQFPESLIVHIHSRLNGIRTTSHNLETYNSHQGYNCRPCSSSRGQPLRGEGMKRILTAVFTMLLACTLAFGQTGGDKKTLNPQPLPPGAHATAATAPTTGKKGGKKHHKGGKKSKKGSSGTSTPPPK